MNSFKTFMNKVGEKVREVAPQAGPNIVEGTDPHNELVEGFLCPTCLDSFESAETLEKHYSSEHLDPSANYLCPVCLARMNSQEELELHYTNTHSKPEVETESLDILRQQLKEVEMTLQEEKWYSLELKKEVENLQEAFKKKGEDAEDYVHKSQLDAVEESKNLLTSEVVLLRKQFAESLEQIGVLRSEKNTLEQKASELSVMKATLKSEVDTLTSEKDAFQATNSAVEENLRTELDTVKHQLMILTSETEQMKTTLKSNENQIETQKKTIAALEIDLQTKSESLSGTQSELTDLKFEMDLLKTKYEEKFCEAEDLLSQMTEKESQLAELMRKDLPRSPEQDKCDDTALLEKQLLQKNQELNSLSTRLADAEKAQTRAQDIARQKSKELGDAHNEISTLTNSLKTADNNSSKSRSELEEQRKINDELRQNANSVRTEYDSAKVRIGDLEQTIERMTGSEQKLRAYCDAQREELQKSEDLLATQISDFEGVQKQQKELQISQKSLEQKNKELIQETEKLKDSLKIAHDDKNDLENQKEKLSQQLAEKLALTEKLQTSIKELENTITNEKQVNISMQKTHDEEMQDFSKKISEISESKTTLVEKLDLTTTKLESKESEIRQLQNEIDKIHKTKEILYEELEVKTKSLDDSQTQLIEKENDLVSLKKQNQLLEEQLEDSQKNLKELTKRQEDNTETLSSLESKVAIAEAESAGLAGDKLELEVKLEAAAEEQRSLLLRCISSEKEVERLQQELTSHRRKLEDSVGALQELGRENQSLQIETAKLAGRKWVEDSEVPNCMSCSKSFSMTVRKHHCRNCGQIFCNDCSSKQIPVEPNKRPVRVCDGCHTEILAKT